MNSANSYKNPCEPATAIVRSALLIFALGWIALNSLQYHGWLPGAFCCIVPFALGVVCARRGRDVCVFACGAGWIFFAGAQYFLGFYSWSGLAVLAVWQAATLAPVAIGLRWLWGRWKLPLTFALPVVWVGGEYLRNIGPLALPTGVLKTPAYDQLWMIQVCDLAGVYGLDFALGMINGLLADLALLLFQARLGSSKESHVRNPLMILQELHRRFALTLALSPRRGNQRSRIRNESSDSGKIGDQSLPLPKGEGWGEGKRDAQTNVGPCFPKVLQIIHPLALPLSATVAVWLFIPAYGWYRLSESEQTMRPGPVLAVVQPDIPYRGDIANGFDPSAYLEEMIGLSDKAIHQNPRPELIVWPEAMSTMPPLNPELLANSLPVPADLDVSREMGLSTIASLRPWVEDTGVPLLLGSLVWRPSLENPDEWRCYNSGMTVAPLKTCDSPRQFKMRLFPGGEHIPGRGTFVHDWLKRALELSGQTGANLEIEPGERREVFSLGVAESDAAGQYDGNESDRANNSARYLISICYEILFPDSSGAFLASEDGRKPFDFLVNISNDGVFQRNAGQLVHWRVAPFRAVESRVGIARAANTGISGFVKPTGEVYGTVKNSRGEVWTGFGAPELPLIADVVERRADESGWLDNPAEYHRLTNDIARIRSMRARAGISGQSTEPVFIDTRRTLYNRTGDLFAGAMLALLLSTASGNVVERLLFRSNPNPSINRQL